MINLFLRGYLVRISHHGDTQTQRKIIYQGGKEPDQKIESRLSEFGKKRGVSVTSFLRVSVTPW